VISESKLNAEIGRLLTVLYEKRFGALDRLTLGKLLNKNPYLYRALGFSDASDFMGQLLVAYVSSSDETIFGNDFIEPLAVFSAQNRDVAPGELWHVSVGASAGQDIAIETAATYLAISVKSSKNILNSQSAKGQSGEFQSLQARLKKINKLFRPIIGFGYGRKSSRKDTVIEKLAGQAFWETLTGEPNFYLRISEAMESFAKTHGSLYKEAFENKHRQLLREFMIEFVSQEGVILWDKVVIFNSAIEKPKKPNKKQSKAKLST
jgi:hypothetical protein